MPVRLTKLPNGRYRVSTPNMVHAKSTTLVKAQAQQRIIKQAEGRMAAPAQHRTLREYVGR